MTKATMRMVGGRGDGDGGNNCHQSLRYERRPAHSSRGGLGDDGGVGGGDRGG